MIGELIILLYPDGGFVSSIVIVSVDVLLTVIGPTFISPLEFVVCVVVPLGLIILN